MVKARLNQTLDAQRTGDDTFAAENTDRSLLETRANKMSSKTRKTMEQKYSAQSFSTFGDKKIVGSSSNQDTRFEMQNLLKGQQNRG